MEDGWYDIDDNGNVAKLSSGGSGAGGTTDHSRLENLDFENSGHTGFQREFTEAEQTWFDMIPSICDSAVNAESGLAEEKTVREEKDIEIETTANEALAIAKGANQAITFDSYDTMWTEIGFNTTANDKYRVGQNVLIKTLNVPDLWIYEVSDSQNWECLSEDGGSFAGDDAFVELLKTQGTVQVGYYILAAIETQSVDLNAYATKEEVEAIEDNGYLYINNAVGELEAKLTPTTSSSSVDWIELINNTHTQITIPYYEPNECYELYIHSYNTIPDVFECSLYILPCAEAPYISDALNIVSTWCGEDCNENGVFTPQANTHYEISFKRVGTDADGKAIIIARVGAWS